MTMLPRIKANRRVIAENHGRSMRSRILGLASVIFGVGLTWAVSATAAEGSVERGQQKNAMCVGCHGIPGYKASFPSVYNVPKIAGQNAKYIESALQAYKKGDRSHPSMVGIAGSLSDQDMADLAAYYAQPSDKPAKAADTLASKASIAEGKQKADQVCGACHAKEGNWNKPADPTYPKLAGQHADYLTQSLWQYQSGRRKNAIMSGIASGLSKDDIKNLSAFLASEPGEIYLLRK